MNIRIRPAVPSLKQFLLRPCPLLITLSFISFAPSRSVEAVTPPPDGAYRNQNTAEGHDALLKLTTGYRNTALGFDALENNEAGMENTATGYSALHSNNEGYSNTATGSQALFLNGGRRL